MAAATEEVSGDDLFDESEKTITLISQEGEPFVVPLRVAITSPYIRAHSHGMVSSDYGRCMTPLNAEEEITLGHLRAPILAKVLEFMFYHWENRMTPIKRPVVSSDLEELVDKWDADFVDVPVQMIFELTLVRTTI